MNNHKEKFKIVHLCLGNFFIDDYGYQENMLPKYHRKMGFDVTVIASLVSFDEHGQYTLLQSSGEYYSKDGFKVIRLNYRKGLKRINQLLRLYQGLSNTIREEHPDILFIHGCQFLDIRIVQDYLKLHPNVKVFVDNHADYNNSASNFLSFYILHKIIWRYCAQIILPFTVKFYGVLPVRCDFLEKMYRIPKSKISLLEMGVDDELRNNGIQNNVREEIRKRFLIKDDQILIVTGGKIDRKKNIHLLIQAVKELNNQNVFLLVFGNTTVEIKKEIISLSQHANIHYVGWIEAEKTNDYFLAADLVVFPGTHSVLWEQAVGCGIPCLVKYWEGMTHIDVGGNVAYLHNDSTSEIKEAIKSIIEIPYTLSAMKEAAMDKGVSRYSYSNISKRAINQ